MNKKKYLIITGGTGGHVIPAINFGNYVISKGHLCYLFVDKRGLKYTSSFNGKIILIKSKHFSNNIFLNIYSFINLLFGFFQSLFYLLKIRPSIGIAFGSYASFSPLLALTILKPLDSKIYLHEQNSVLGKVNRYFSFKVNKIFLNFKKTNKIKKKYINKCFHVGLPRNYQIKYKYRQNNLIKDEIIKIFILGGSQGAKNLNRSLVKQFINFPKAILNQLEFVFQCPLDQKEYIEKKFKSVDLEIKYELDDFYYNIYDRLHENDLLIARSGAGTINDVVFSQIPSILVPLPSSTDQHQLFNASFLIEQNAAFLIEEKNLEKKENLLSIINIIKDTKKRNKIIHNLQKIENFDTNELIYNYTYEI